MPPEEPTDPKREALANAMMQFREKEERAFTELTGILIEYTIEPPTLIEPLGTA